MLKTLKTLVLLATVSCGYTSNLNNQSNLNNITNNHSTINNNVDNFIFSNDENNNNDTLNTNKYLGKKRISTKLVKKKNNAYKYLFNDKDNKYFRKVTCPTEVYNPEYKQFMENLYDMLDNIFTELYDVHSYKYENKNTSVTNSLSGKNLISLKKVKNIAQLFDDFKFSDAKNYVLANNSVSNLHKYVKHNGYGYDTEISAYNFYFHYVWNHINKLYYQTVNAIKKSINNHEHNNKQIEIVNEFGRVFKNVMYKIMDQDNDNLFPDIDYSMFVLSDALNEFNCIKKDVRKQFKDIHENLIKYYLDELISNINNYQKIIIDTTNINQIGYSSKKFFNDLLDGLNIDDKTAVLVSNCRDFLINGRKNITIQQYLPEFVANLDVLYNITDKKIQYQIEHEHTITFDKSVNFYILYVATDILDEICEQCKNDNKLYDELFDLCSSIDHERSQLCFNNCDAD